MNAGERPYAHASEPPTDLERVLARTEARPQDTASRGG